MTIIGHTWTCVVVCVFLYTKQQQTKLAAHRSSASPPSRCPPLPLPLSNCHRRFLPLLLHSRWHNSGGDDGDGCVHCREAAPKSQLQVWANLVAAAAAAQSSDWHLHWWRWWWSSSSLCSASTSRRSFEAPKMTAATVRGDDAGQMTLAERPALNWSEETVVHGLVQGGSIREGGYKIGRERGRKNR